MRIAMALVVSLLGTSVHAQTSYKAQHATPNGSQILAIYMGSTDCAPCVWPPLKNAVHAAWPLLARQAADANIAFATLGIAMDDDVATGIALLSPTEEYDEVIVGAGWINHGVTQYMLSDTTTAPSIPRMLVVERKAGHSEDWTQWHVGQFRVLRLLSGADEIRRWVAQGAPIAIPPVDQVAQTVVAPVITPGGKTIASAKPPEARIAAVPGMAWCTDSSSRIDIADKDGAVARQLAKIAVETFPTVRSADRLDLAQTVVLLVNDHCRVIGSGILERKADALTVHGTIAEMFPDADLTGFQVGGISELVAGTSGKHGAPWLVWMLVKS